MRFKKRFEIGSISPPKSVFHLSPKRSSWSGFDHIFEQLQATTFKQICWPLNLDFPIFDYLNQVKPEMLSSQI